VPVVAEPALPAKAGKAAKARPPTKKDLAAQSAAVRAKLVKSIHETFLATAAIQFDAAEYAAFQLTWTLTYVTGRLELAEWMQGESLTVHVYTCTCNP
jgi:hypothetical protein